MLSLAWQIQHSLFPCAANQAASGQIFSYAIDIDRGSDLSETVVATMEYEDLLGEQRINEPRSMRGHEQLRAISCNLTTLAQSVQQARMDEILRFFDADQRGWIGIG